MEIDFTKMHGLGNDFIFIDDRTGSIEQYTDFSFLARKLCPRHFGIGADGIIIINESERYDFKFTIYNCDGSESQMCGNGMRCFAKYLYENSLTSKTELMIETKAGLIIPRMIIDGKNKVESVIVDMGEPVLVPENIPFITDNKRAVKEKLYLGENDGETDNTEYVEITALSMGNPHAVLFVDNLDTKDIKKTGMAIENHARFPEKTNVEFIKVVKNDELIMKVWERGAGQTLACGTGACAALVAACLNKICKNRAVVHLDGGDLEIEWNRHDNHVYKKGDASFLFSGRIKI